MRERLVEELSALARVDPRIVLLTADLGFAVLDKFAAEFPERYFNVGVAEQSLIATATGLAEAGFIPYCYSIATFASLRGLEFIRNGPVAHRLPVRIIGIGPGMDYGFDGLSHFAVDDIGTLRCQPGLTIWAPADNSDISDQISSINSLSGPVYMRILRNGPKCAVSRLSAASDIGKKICVLSLGDAHLIGDEIIAKLKDSSLEASHQVVTLLDQTTAVSLKRHLLNSAVCIIAENHYVIGGLASLVSEVVANNGLNIKVITVGVESLPIGKLGNASYLRERFMTNIDDAVRDAQRFVTTQAKAKK